MQSSGSRRLSAPALDIRVSTSTRSSSKNKIVTLDHRDLWKAASRGSGDQSLARSYPKSTADVATVSVLGAEGEGCAWRVRRERLIGAGVH